MAPPTSNNDERKLSNEEINDKKYSKSTTTELYECQRSSIFRSSSLSIVKKKIYANLEKPTLPEYKEEPTGSIKVILNVLKKRNWDVPKKLNSEPALNVSPIVTRRRTLNFGAAEINEFRRNLSEPLESKNKSENYNLPVVRNNYGENHGNHSETCIDA